MFDLITFGAWSPQAAESNIRGFLALVLLIIVSVKAIQAYSKGRKGVAIAEGIAGALIWIFVKYPNAIESLGDWAKNTLGF